MSVLIQIELEVDDGDANAVHRDKQHQTNTLLLIHPVQRTWFRSFELCEVYSGWALENGGGKCSILVMPSPVHISGKTSPFIPLHPLLNSPEY
jgi:hypothetical protein